LYRDDLVARSERVPVLFFRPPVDVEELNDREVPPDGASVTRAKQLASEAVADVVEEAAVWSDDRNRMGDAVAVAAAGAVALSSPFIAHTVRMPFSFDAEFQALPVGAASPAPAAPT
jgi:hypothetical protein